MTWLERKRRDNLQYIARKRRLLCKAQKAGVVGRVSQILDQYESWNRRFGIVASMRASHEE
jgi:hypothetical protein